MATSLHRILCRIHLHHPGRWYPLPYSGRSIRCCVHCGRTESKSYP